MTEGELFNRNLSRFARTAFAKLPRETQESMFGHGTTVNPSGDDVELTCNGYVYGKVTRAALSDPDFDPDGGEWVDVPDDLSGLDA